MSAVTTPAKNPSTPASTRRARQITRERMIAWLLLGSGLLSILTTLGIVFSLFSETVAFFAKVSFLEFITEPRWTPMFDPAHYGIAPLLSGTFIIAGGSALVAVPLGLASAIYLS
ncbi:MAG TPA: phosphate ABC transporter permease subunit PstC, partial [Symbiobacteriaceae bacterium]|nr:phosphate ABC transporter permease subunit PstC [Symbiobacteriaceae bacterium]